MKSNFCSRTWRDWKAPTSLATLGLLKISQAITNMERKAPRQCSHLVNACSRMLIQGTHLQFSAAPVYPKPGPFLGNLRHAHALVVCMQRHRHLLLRMDYRVKKDKLSDRVTAFGGLPCQLEIAWISLRELAVIMHIGMGSLPSFYGEIAWISLSVKGCDFCILEWVPHSGKLSYGGFSLCEGGFLPLVSTLWQTFLWWIFCVKVDFRHWFPHSGNFPLAGGFLCCYLVQMWMLAHTHTWCGLLARDKKAGCLCCESVATCQLIKNVKKTFPLPKITRSNPKHKILIYIYICMYRERERKNWYIYIYIQYIYL